MSAFSTVGDFFSDLEFPAVGNAHLWVIGGLEEPHAFSSCPGARTRGNFTKPDASCSTTQTSASRQAICPRTFLSFSTSCVNQSPWSAQAQLRRLERATGKQERERLGKRLAQQSTPSASSSQPQAGTASVGNPTTQQQPTSTASAGNVPVLHSIRRSIGSVPVHPNIDLRDRNGDHWCSWMSRKQHVFFRHQLEKLPAP